MIRISALALASLFFTVSLSAQTTQDLVLTTGDGLQIAATVTLPAGTGAHSEQTEPVPAVILVHQAGSTRAEWNNLIPRLTDEGWVSLAYDIRGHGESDPIDGPVSSLFNDPGKAPLDLKAALDYVRSLGFVDPDRVAVVGASVGANLAAMSTGRFNVRTAVALSAKESAVFDLGGDPELRLRSVFYIASELEQGGARADWAVSLSERTDAPKRVFIVRGSAGHGVSVFNDDSTVPEQIVNWLRETL